MTLSPYLSHESPQLRPVLPGLLGEVLRHVYVGPLEHLGLAEDGLAVLERLEGDEDGTAAANLGSRVDAGGPLNRDLAPVG